MINGQDFIAWIGSGDNKRGTFPANLSELNDDICEFADRRKKHLAQYIDNDKVEKLLRELDKAYVSKKLLLEILNGDI